MNKINNKVICGMFEGGTATFPAPLAFYASFRIFQRYPQPLLLLNPFSTSRFYYFSPQEAFNTTPYPSLVTLSQIFGVDIESWNPRDWIQKDTTRSNHTQRWRVKAVCAGFEGNANEGLDRVEKVFYADFYQGNPRGLSPAGSRIHHPFAHTKQRNPLNRGGSLYVPDW